MTRAEEKAQQLLNSATLVRLAAEISGCPTLKQMDAMLVEISKLPQDNGTRGLEDRMLDMRALIVASHN